jgi:hypothetical protein
MKYRILTSLLAACCFALPGLAAPDLSGKSPAFVAAYEAAYSQCITNGKRASTVRKKPAEIAACEQSALAEATAATAQTASTLIDRVSIPGIGQTPDLNLPTVSPDGPTIVLTQDDMDEMKRNMDPNRMILTIPIDFQNLPTQFPNTVRDEDRPDKIVFLIGVSGMTLTDENQWRALPDRSVDMKVELDYPIDGNLQTDLKVPLEGPGPAYDGLDFRFFGNSDRHRLGISIRVRTKKRSGSEDNPFEYAWDQATSIFRFADVSYVTSGQFEKGKWVRLRRYWSGPTPDEFVTATSECHDDNSLNRDGPSQYSGNGPTARSCEALVQE